MSISIEKEKCVGCGRCTEVCPGNLLEISDGKARICDVCDCWGCTACVKECARDAVFYYLSANLGGAGGRLYAHDTDDTLTWELRLAEGSAQEIVVEKNKANTY